MRVEFNRRWEIGAQLGAGGFGRVFVATGDDGTVAAAKFVPKARGAERELLFVQLDNVRNVVPVIDYGETSDAWVLVMPRADRSLRDELTDAGGRLSLDRTLAVLRDVATALADMDRRVVHRDLKPENILLLHGAWRLADFGISRYAEASTASDTRKFAMSPPYAAPERWRAERATIATDVYALGVIAVELLTGPRPFPGPSLEDYHEQRAPQRGEAGGAERPCSPRSPAGRRRIQGGADGSQPVPTRSRPRQRRTLGGRATARVRRHRARLGGGCVPTRPTVGSALGVCGTKPLAVLLRRRDRRYVRLVRDRLHGEPTADASG